MTEKFTLAVTGQSLIKYDIRDIDTPPFGDVRALLQNADLSFTNFEGTILGEHGGWPLKGSFFGCSEPVVLDALSDAGFGALSLSNNHAFDLGPPGVLSTIEEVERRGFLHAGLGRNHSEASKASRAVVGQKRVAVLAMDGGPGPDFMYASDAGDGRPARPGVNRLRLSQVIEVDHPAFDELRLIGERVGYTSIDLANDSQPDDPRVVNTLEELALGRSIFKKTDGFGRNVKVDHDDFKRHLEAISAAANDGYMVVAYLHHHHWASDWYEVPDWVGAVARQCVDAGAAMFVSHGAPVLQPVEIYRRRPIFYSLGNFIFHVRSEKSTWHAREVWESVVGVCTYGADNNLIDIKFHPVLIGGEDAQRETSLEDRRVPHLVTGDSAQRILLRFKTQSAKLGAEIEISDGVGLLRVG